MPRFDTILALFEEEKKEIEEEFQRRLNALEQKRQATLQHHALLPNGLITKTQKAKYTT